MEERTGVEETHGATSAVTGVKVACLIRACEGECQGDRSVIEYR